MHRWFLEEVCCPFVAGVRKELVAGFGIGRWSYLVRVGVQRKVLGVRTVKVCLSMRPTGCAALSAIA